MKHSKTVKLYVHAGLCNQLFMIFSIMSYCIDNTCSMLIYSREDRTLSGNKTYWGTILDALKGVIVEKIDNTIPTYEEKNFHFDEIPKFNSDFNARGYFQSYKYFERNYDSIVQTLGLREKQAITYARHQSLFKRKTIAIHFRMGDYMYLQQNHPIMKAQYYHDALCSLEKSLGNIGDSYDILYFCQKQDNEIVGRYIGSINKDRGYNFVKVSDDIDDWEQLLVMSQCNHFIIANSTFSWFGAYLCDKADKIVVRPSLWFGEALNHKDTKDVCPQNWIKI